MVNIPDNLDVLGDAGKAVVGGATGAVTTRLLAQRFGRRKRLKRGATELHVEFGLLVVAQMNDEPGLGSPQHLLALWREYRHDILRVSPEMYSQVERGVRRMVTPEAGGSIVDSHNVEAEAAMVILEPMTQLPQAMHLMETRSRVRVPSLRRRNGLAPLAFPAG